MSFSSEVDEFEQHLHPTFESYCEQGLLTEAILFHEVYPQDQYNHVGYKLAAQHGHLEFAKWCYQLNPLNVSMDDHCFAFVLSSTDHPQLAKWILTLLTTRQELQRCLQHACFTKNLLLTEWIVELYPEFIHDPLTPSFLTGLLYHMCTSDQLTFAKLLWATLPHLSPSEESHAFTSACFAGSLEIAKWLFGVSEYSFLTADDFTRVCQHGRFEVARWWGSVHPEQHLHYLFYAFYHLCHTHDMDCAKVMFTLFPSIPLLSMDHLLFKDALLRKDTVMAIWFCSLRPDVYTLTITNGVISDYSILS